MNKTEKFWDKVSNKFDKRSKKLDQTEIKTLENTKKYLNVNDIVLDYGCGIGIMSVEISDNVKLGIVPYIRFFRISEFEDLIANGNFQIVETESLHSIAEHYFIVAKKT